MAIKSIDQWDASTFRSWGNLTVLKLRSEIGAVAKMTPDQLRAADFAELKDALNDYEQMRKRADELDIEFGGWARIKREGVS